MVSAVNEVKNQIDSQLKSIGRSIAATGNSITAIGAGATAFGAASTFGFGKAVQAAGDFAETVNMFEAVFKSQSTAVRKWGKDYAEVVNRSEAQLLDFLAQSQDTFVPLGFDRNEAAELSKTVAKLAIDLGSFKNIDDGDALRRVLGGLVGNTENLKLFGVQATQAAIKAKALSLGFDPDNLTSYQKALAILEITLDGTADAQGDAIRTAGEFVNSVKGLRAELMRLSIALGTPIKGAVTAVVQGITDLISGIAGLIERFPILAQLAAGVGVAIIGIGLAATAAGIALAAMGSALGTAGILAVGALIRANGIVGTFTLLTTSARAVVVSLNTALAAQAVRFTAANAAAVTFSGTLKGLAATIAAFSSSFLGIFRAGALTAIWSSFVVAGQTAIAAITTAVAGLFSFIVAGASRLAVALINPWSLLIIAIGAALKLAESYYKKQQEFEKSRGEKLENERQSIVGESFRAAGQAVPADLGKTLDIDKARVVGGKSEQLSQEQLDLSKEIIETKTAFEEFRMRMEVPTSFLSVGRSTKISLKNSRRKKSRSSTRTTRPRRHASRLKMNCKPRSKHSTPRSRRRPNCSHLTRQCSTGRGKRRLSNSKRTTKPRKWRCSSAHQPRTFAWRLPKRKRCSRIRQRI